MVQRTEQVKEVSPSGRVARTTETVEDTSRDKVHGQTVAERVVWYIAGVLLVLLAFRFVLTLLGANQANGFANFIYSTSHPFVAPFFGLFGYNLSYGVSRFETFTLVAIAVYALVAWGIAKLLTINRPDTTA